MKGTFALFDIAGYVALLLWGTHMVTSGVLRGYGSALRRSLGRFLGRRPAAFTFGVCITALLQRWRRRLPPMASSDWPPA
jgi:phosphate:Na+ symporter